MTIHIKHHPFDGSGPVELHNDVDGIMKAREILEKRRARMIQKGFDAEFTDDDTLEITDRDDALTTSSYAGVTKIHIINTEEMDF